MAYAKVAGIPYPFFMAAQAGLIVALIAIYSMIGSPDRPPTHSRDPATRSSEQLSDREWIEKFGPVDINSATQQELERVHGIGPAKARIIIENRPHNSIEDLSGLKGIFPRDLEVWQGQIKCTPVQQP